MLDYASMLQNATPISAQPVTTTGDENIIVDLDPNQAGIASQVAMVLMLSFLGTLTTRQPDTRGGPPISGLFLCPKGTPIETLTQSQAGVNVDARPIVIPLADPALNVSTVGAVPTYIVGMQTQSGLIIPVPAGWFLRAILACNQGTATPGPGAGSIGKLTALISLQGDCPCS